MDPPIFDFVDPIPVNFPPGEDIQSMIDGHPDLSSNQESRQALFDFSAPQIIHEVEGELNYSNVVSLQGNFTSLGPAGDTELAPVNPFFYGSCFPILFQNESSIHGAKPGEYFCVPRDEFLNYMIHVGQQQMLRPPLKRKLDETTVRPLERGDEPNIAEVSFGKMPNVVEQSASSLTVATENSYSPKSKKFKWDQGQEESEDRFNEDIIKLANIEDQYSVLLRELPDLDPEVLYGHAFDLDGDAAKLRAFIDQQRSFGLMTNATKLMDERLDMLYAEFPNLDRAELFDDLQACDGNEEMFKNLITCLRQNESERRVVEDAIQNALSILNECDPAFLHSEMKECGQDLEEFNRVVMTALETGKYDKLEREDPELRLRKSLWTNFVTNIDPLHYLRVVPDPQESFLGISAQHVTDNKHSRLFLSWRYGAAISHSTATWMRAKRSLTSICDELDLTYPITPGVPPQLQNQDFTEAFLLEVAFIANRRPIVDAINRINADRARKLEAARENNILLQCDCCYADLIFELATPCPREHLFCHTCIRKYCETSLSDGKTKLKCLADCEENFNLVALEPTLPPQLLEKIVRKVSSAEVLEAKIPDLEVCKFCEYAYIPGPTDKIFKCGNPDCSKETCRSCGEQSHIPYGCKEVEKPRDVAARQRIEEAMTDKLLRTCHKCKKKFVKISGCDTVTCTCGAITCYHCKKPMKSGYDHPSCNGIRNEAQQIRKAGINAKKKELKNNPGLNLVHDPTKF